MRAPVIRSVVEVAPYTLRKMISMTKTTTEKIVEIIFGI